MKTSTMYDALHFVVFSIFVLLKAAHRLSVKAGDGVMGTLVHLHLPFCQFELSTVLA